MRNNHYARYAFLIGSLKLYRFIQVISIFMVLNLSLLKLEVSRGRISNERSVPADSKMIVNDGKIFFSSCPILVVLQDTFQLTYIGTVYFQ